MANPLFHLAQALEARAAKRRSFRRLKDVQNDPHLARDVGLPYRRQHDVKIDRW
ncbi:hypothetical protein N9L47_00280 [Rhodobacteraceae bacterium]|nr:hypothetical protein [Paracoccaceae bacterium]